jgi:rhamnulokinase
MKEITVLAVDLGAESGRVMAVHYSGKGLRLEELHRFQNLPVKVQGTIHWDFLSLWRNIQLGIDKGSVYQPASLGVDTWGVDFGLLDSHGDLIGNPVHYRDERTNGMMGKVFQRVPKSEVYHRTGIQFMPLNTLYQMMSLVESGSPQLEIASTFLTSPDLINYWMTGEKVCEFTNATTTQMYNPHTGNWDSELMDKLGIPTHLFPEIVTPGTRLGEYQGIPVIAPACHDTGSAVAAVPTNTKEYAYISSGTWSLVGLEVSEPVINSDSLNANITNEGGVYGTYRLLKNVTGMWILQQCREDWAQQGDNYSYDDLVRMASSAPPLKWLIDPNDLIFLTQGDHPERIRSWCKQTGQEVPDTRGAVVRCVLESLAIACRRVLEELSALSGMQIKVIHIVGGGSQNELLNQITADATGIPVQAGPVEATVMGNALVQFITLGELKDIQEARDMVAQMDALKTYQPQDTGMWDQAYQKGFIS